MTRTTMVAQSWKPLRRARCALCSVRFVIGWRGSNYRLCGDCLRKVRR